VAAAVRKPPTSAASALVALLLVELDETTALAEVRAAAVLERSSWSREMTNHANCCSLAVAFGSCTQESTQDIVREGMGGQRLMAAGL
jgi:hypothetical protein